MSTISHVFHRCGQPKEKILTSVEVSDTGQNGFDPISAHIGSIDIINLFVY